VAALAGEHLVPATLELGGKDAAIVLPDADLDRAAAGIAWAGNLNAGQACLSVERVYVAAPVAEPFLERLVAEVERLRVGLGEREDVDVPAITTEAQLAVIEAQVEDAVRKGARILCGGERISAGSRFYRPTVIADVQGDMRVMTEETFGPVIAVQSVADAEEAIERTNAAGFGLTASLWTQDLRRGQALAGRLRVGDVALNEHAAPAGHAEIPWGGRGLSGYGKTRGAQGLLEMTTWKHVSWPRFRTRREPYWFPYSGKMLRLVRSALVLLYGSWAERFRLVFRERR
jgi:succinate-semialdehyde dehydrogenase/glutarate-semialdehyde dehydrogenase